MKCAKCAGRSFKKTSSEERLEACGRKFIKDVPATLCTTCGDVFVHLAEIQRLELEAAGSIAQSGVVSGETFRFMRKALSMTAIELAPLLGVAPETLSRWENGGRNVDRTAWITLGGLVLDRLQGHSSTLERLRSAVSARPARPKVVRL